MTWGFIYTGKVLKKKVIIYTSIVLFVLYVINCTYFAKEQNINRIYGVGKKELDGKSGKCSP